MVSKLSLCFFIALLCFASGSYLKSKLSTKTSALGCPSGLTAWSFVDRRIVACCPGKLQASLNGANQEVICCPSGQPVSIWSKKCADGSRVESVPVRNI